MIYRMNFTGRLKGAIGISYQQDVHVEADTPEGARLKLYETHEHIHGLRTTPVVAPEESKCRLRFLRQPSDRGPAR